MNYPKTFALLRQSTNKIEEFTVINEEQNIVSNEYYEREIIKAKKKIEKLIKDIEFYREIIITSELL